MILCRIALLLLSGLALGACSSSYTFTASAYPLNIAPHETGWTWLATVSVQDASGTAPGEPALKKCLIEVVDRHQATLLSEVVQVKGGLLKPRIEWQEGPLLLVGIYAAAPEEGAPLYQARYYLQGKKFRKAPPAGPQGFDSARSES